MSEKRNVSTDALETLGMIIGEGEKRDAIHLAVEPVVAGAKLYPGQDIGLWEGKAMPAKVGGAIAGVDPLGIVDPFLKAPVNEGERFWLVVYPRQITSLRHVWSHPAFRDEATTLADEPSTEASEKWLREWIADADCPSYDKLMPWLKTLLEGGRVPSLNPEYYGDVVGFADWDESYLHFQGTDAHGEIPPEFWQHVEVVLGVKIPDDKKATSFSCSC
jgi:hypothetical protein